MTVRVSRLANGLRVVSDTAAHLKTAAVGIWVDAGARHETPEINGVAHLLEHMAFKGTERRSARAIAEEIEAVGGHLNAYTSREQTAYYARVLSEDVPLAVDILADILQHSVFADEDLERERQVVIQEIGQAEDTPDDIIFDHLQLTAYPDQALGRPILGTAPLVAGLGREHLGGYMARHYRAPSMVLAAAGGIDHDALLNLAEAAFAGVAPEIDRPAEPGRYGGGDRRLVRDLEQAHLALAFPGVDYRDPDFQAVQVYSMLLGGGMSSRLFQQVREVRGLAYQVFSFSSSYTDTGLFSVYAATGEEDMAELVPVIAHEMQQVSVDLEEPEVARARAQLKAGLLMSLESSSSRCEQLGRQMLVYGRPLEVDQVLAEIDAIGVADIQRVARRIATGGKPTVAALGPVGRLENFERIAARFG